MAAWRFDENFETFNSKGLDLRRDEWENWAKSRYDARIIQGWNEGFGDERGDDCWIAIVLDHLDEARMEIVYGLLWARNARSQSWTRCNKLRAIVEVPYAPSTHIRSTRKGDSRLQVLSNVVFVVLDWAFIFLSRVMPKF